MGQESFAILIKSDILYYIVINIANNTNFLRGAPLR